MVDDADIYAENNTLRRDDSHGLRGPDLQPENEPETSSEGTGNTGEVDKRGRHKKLVKQTDATGDAAAAAAAAAAAVQKASHIRSASSPAERTYAASLKERRGRK